MSMTVSALSARIRAVVGPSTGVVVLSSVGSTNDLARRIAAEYADDGAAQPNVIVAALAQTAGRGRQGREWRSPAEGGLYASVLHLETDAARLGAIPLAVAVALARVLDRVAPGRVRLEWPNDILLDGGKVAGILVEAATRGGSAHAIVGVGVNQRRDKLLPEGASAVGEVAGGPDLIELAAVVVEAVWEALEAPRSLVEVVTEWRTFSVHAKGDPLTVRLADEQIEGTFVALTDDGRLLLATAAGERAVASGEIIEDATP